CLVDPSGNRAKNGPQQTKRTKVSSTHIWGSYVPSAVNAHRLPFLKDSVISSQEPSPPVTRRKRVSYRNPPPQRLPFLNVHWSLAADSPPEICNSPLNHLLIA